VLIQIRLRGASASHRLSQLVAAALIAVPAQRTWAVTTELKIQLSASVALSTHRPAIGIGNCPRRGKPNSRVTRGHFDHAERQPGCHIQLFSEPRRLVAVAIGAARMRGRLTLPDRRGLGLFLSPVLFLSTHGQAVVCQHNSGTTLPGLWELPHWPSQAALCEMPLHSPCGSVQPSALA
jgi:hypothetical protein